MRRFYTAREQAELAGFWRTADEDAPKKIYRGIRLTNLPEELRQKIYDLQQLPMDESQVGQHMQIGPLLLDHLQNTPWRPFTQTPDELMYTGLGRHWTRRPEFAATAASNQIGPGMSVILEADDPGDQYYDPDIPMTGKRPGDPPWAGEEEATLLPNTPLNLTSIRLPGKTFDEVLDDPYYRDMEQEYGHPYPGGPRPGIGGVSRDPFAKKAHVRQAMPPRKIPPMNYDSSTFTKQIRQLIYTDDEIAGNPERANLIRCQGGSCTNTAGEPAVMMSFIHHDEGGAPIGILHYFPEGSRGAREKPGGVQVMVHPDHQGKGVGTKLLDEAMAKYGPEGSERLSHWSPIDLEEQQYTPSGYGLYERYKGNHTAAQATDADWYRQAVRIAAQAAELEWRHSLDGGPEWELIANPPTGQTQVIQTEDSRHQHYGVRNARVFSGGGGLQGDDPIADQKEYWRTQVMLPGMNRIPHTPGPFTGPPHSVPQGEDPEAAAFGLSHPQPSLPGMEVVQPADDVVRDLKRTPSEGAAPYGDRLERALYDEFMDWWPTSTAYATRTNDEGGPDQWVTTGWMHHPDEPITHWMNVEDFLKERYPEAATGSHYGLEDADQVMGYLDRWDRPDPPTEEEMRGMGYTSLGNVYTQAMLNLHNKLQGRNWATDADRDRYMRLMLKHLGPQKAARLARLVRTAETMQEWRKRINRELADENWARRSLTPAQQREKHMERAKQKSSYDSSFYSWDSRPQPGDEDYEGGPEQLDQDTLPGMEDILGESTRLWRGLPINTSDPAFRRVWQMTYGQGEPVDDPGLFPDADLRYEDRGGEYDHPGLADAIMDGFEAMGGVGEHHSTSFDVSDDYGRGNAAGSDVWGEGPHLPVLLDSDWNGAEEDYSRAGSGNFPQEKEITLRHRRAPLRVVDVRVPTNADEAEGFSSYDDFDGWNSIMTTPRDITAAGTGFSCPPGQPGCVSAMGNPLKVEMPESKAPTAADYAEPWDANQTPADYSNSSYYIDRSGVGYPSSGGGTGGGGSWGGGGGSPDADNILPSSRALYDQLMQDYPGADIGGYRVDSYGEHARGALDFMTSDPAQAAEIRQKAFDAGAPYVLWQQRQWNADGTSSPMENRGDPTQNHYDHVHIAPIGG